MILFFWILLFVTSSCRGPSVDVIHKSVTKNDLASAFVKSPDPRREAFQEGEQLLISWNLGVKQTNKHTLIVSVLFKDRSEEKIYKELESSSGVFSYFLVGKEFKDKQGIMTYKVEVLDFEKKSLIELEDRLWINIIRVEPAREDE